MEELINWRENPLANIYGTCEMCGRTKTPYEENCENHKFVDSRDYIDVPNAPSEGE